MSITEVALPPKSVDFEYCMIGPVVFHNYLCAVCKDQPAVNVSPGGYLEPCWGCQKKYRLIKLTWIDRLLGRHKK